MASSNPMAKGQMSFLGAVLAERDRPTARWEFLQTMDRVVPWRDLLDQVARVYKKPGNGRPPYPLEPLLRLYLVAQWFDLSDVGAEEAVLDSEAIRLFCRIDLWHSSPPASSTIKRFRQLLDDTGNSGPIQTTVGMTLAQHSLRLESGVIVEPSARPAWKRRANK